MVGWHHQLNGLESEQTLADTFFFFFPSRYSMDMNLSKLQETVKDRGAWCAAVHSIAKSGMQLSNYSGT